MALHIRAYKLPDPVREYQFDANRKWRCDFAWPDLLIAVEVEGGINSGGRHVRPEGFKADMVKYNALALAGWRLFRYDIATIKRGWAVEQIKQAISIKQPA